MPDARASTIRTSRTREPWLAAAPSIYDAKSVEIQQIEWSATVIGSAGILTDALFHSAMSSGTVTPRTGQLGSSLGTLGLRMRP